MFKKATKRFVREIDSKGSLIPASSMFDSDHFYPLHLLHKRTDGPFWRKPRYEPIHLEIKQIVDLQISLIRASTVSFDFRQMEDSDKISLKANIEVMPVKGSVQGSRFVSESFSLRTEKLSIDVIEIINSLKGRKIKEHRDFIERNYYGELYMVTEALVSKEVFTMKQSTKHEYDIRFSVSPVFQMEGKQQKPVEKKLKIPKGTVIAYKVWELTVDPDGTLGLSLPQKKPGIAYAFAADAFFRRKMNDKYHVCHEFQYLESRAKPQLLDLVCQIIEDFEVCSFLEDALCNAYNGINPEKLDFDALEAPGRDHARALLDWLGILREYQPKAAKEDYILKAVCLLVGAVVDLPSAILPMLVESLKMEIIAEQLRVVTCIFQSAEAEKVEGNLDAGSVTGDAFEKTVAILKEAGVELERSGLGLRYHIGQTGKTSLWELHIVLYSLKALSSQ